MGECTKLRNVSLARLPNLEEITEYAFDGCSTLEEIELSDLPQLQGIEKFRFRVLQS